MSTPTPDNALATQDLFSSLGMFNQDDSNFTPIWFAVKEMGFASDVEVCTEIKGHILAIRKTRRHSEKNANGQRIAECIMTNLIPEQGTVVATGECRNCATCAFNRWASATDDKGNPAKGKACREKRLVLVLRDGDALPVVVAAPPKSIKAADNFKTLMETKGKPLPLAHVTLGTDRRNDNGNDYGVLKITPDRELQPAEAQQLVGRLQLIQAKVQRWLNANTQEIDRDDIEETDEVAGTAHVVDEATAASTQAAAAQGSDRF